MFLVKDDYLPLIREDKLNQITQDSDPLLTKALPASQEEAAGYIRHRYDNDKVFKSVTEVTTDTVPAAAVDDRFYQSTSQFHYVAIADGGTDLADTNSFTQSDSRNPKLVEVLVDIVLYNIHSRINPKSVPTQRKIRYDGDDPEQRGGAIGWLKNVQKGSITPDLPVITDEDGETPQNTESVAYGTSSNTAYGY